MVICDEVYEHLVYDGKPHIPLRHPAGHAAAKTLSRLGRQDLLADGLESGLGDGGPRGWSAWSTKAHQFLTFTTPPALQTGCGAWPDP